MSSVSSLPLLPSRCPSARLSPSPLPLPLRRGAEAAQNKLKGPAGRILFETVPKGSNYKITRAGRGAEAAQNNLKGPAGPNFF